jgi:phosphoglycolate phosphatase-like HAD superfamily hydrolase
MDKIHTLILDVDGVILDSNHLKEQNIHQAAKPFGDPIEIAEFVRYFVDLNGVPREHKINKFFGRQPDVSRTILRRYNALNQATLLEVELTKGCQAFLLAQAHKQPTYALSGGKESEVKAVLNRKGLASYFKKIMGGPTTKSEHLERLPITRPAVFVGDSRHDAEVAKRFDLKFIFMHQYTQFQDWKSHFRGQPEVTIIPDLTVWPTQHLTT